MRERRAVVVAAAVVALLLTGGVIAFKSLTDANRHFVNYVHSYATNWRSSKLPGRPQRDRAWINGHHVAVVAAGKRSCAWLTQQPNAPVIDPSGRFDADRMAMRYVTNVEGKALPLARMTMWHLVGGAWHYLCRDQMEAKTAPRSTQDD